MKAVDPSISLMGAFPSPGLVQNAGEYLDYVCPHHYECHELAKREAEVIDLRKMLAEKAPGRNIRLGITEWNTTAGNWGLERAMLWTLDNALWCSRYHNLMHRHCDAIEIANRSNLADSFCCGILQTNNHDMFKTPTYYAQQLYAVHAGQYPLKVGGHDIGLDVSATLSKQEDRIDLFVVNPTLEAKQQVVDLTAFTRADGCIKIWTVADTEKAGDREAANSWRSKERIRTMASEVTVGSARWTYTFQPLSLTVMEVRVEK
jgi:alpha-L-arabinofuranosidase